MKPLDRNIGALEHIVVYCQQIEQTIDRFGNSYAAFQSDPIYRNAAALCILQIGEISKQFSQEFLSSNSQIPWKLIARTRDLYAHHYGAVDFELLWETAVGDIPEVTRFCRSYLEG